MRSNPSNQRLLIDARPLQTADAGRGIGRYVRGLLEGLVVVGQGPLLGVLVQSGLPLPDLPAAGLVAYRVNRRRGQRLAVWEDAWQLGRELAEIQPRLFHATRLSLPSRSPCPLVVTLHDLIPWALGGRAMLGERVRYWPARRLLRTADRVLAVSQRTAEDAMRLARVAQARIRVVGEGVDSRFKPAPGAAARVAERWGVRAPYLLFVGSLDPRKNPAGLLQAWRTARSRVPDLELVVAGSPGASSPPDGARVLGRVSDAELVDLLSAGACLLFPSRYEGFGLPLLEAMACACPVVAFANSSLAEVAGDVATLVPDGDAEALGKAAAELVLDISRARAARRAGRRHAARFTWQDVGRQVAEVYSELLA